MAARRDRAGLATRSGWRSADALAGVRFHAAGRTFLWPTVEKLRQAPRPTREIETNIATMIRMSNRLLGLKQYQTAWSWLHKFRSAMVRPGRDLLTGREEVDETYLVGLEEGLRGRLVEKKALPAM